MAAYRSIWSRANDQIVWIILSGDVKPAWNVRVSSHWMWAAHNNGISVWHIGKLQASPIYNGHNEPGSAPVPNGWNKSNSALAPHPFIAVELAWENFSVGCALSVLPVWKAGELAKESELYWRMSFIPKWTPWAMNGLQWCLWNHIHGQFMFFSWKKKS